MMQKFSNIPVFCTVGLAVLGGYKAIDVKPEVEPKGRVAGLNAHETHASASLLGQFRTSVSGWLWVRTDLYLHNGVQMRPLSEAEIENGRKGVGSSDNHEGTLHDDSKVVTVIPSADRDFRGIFGDIERATSSYRDMTNHDHNNPKQSLPLFRLMTWLDPYFIPGWTTGAAVLAFGKEERGYHKSIEFLDQGLEQNPNSIAIYNQKGYVQLTRLHKFQDSLKSFQRARVIGLSINPKLLTEDDQEGLQMSYRWLALIHRNLGNLDQMYEVLREGREKFSDDAILERMLNAPPVVRISKEAKEDIQRQVQEEASESAEFH
jgi:tetratricopeptide (TPR) repeat protein